jgi:hypothetical protein
VLIIRDAQISALAEPGIRRFRERAVLHLRTAVPETCAALGEDAVQASVDLALRKSREYGFREERDIVGYLNLMYLLGFDFDTDPRYAWTRDVLRATAAPGRWRMECLTERVLSALGCRS